MATEFISKQIDAIDWTQLKHAYGSAGDVAEYLKQLRSNDEDEYKNALWELQGNIYHQGTRYSAAIPAVRIICSLAGEPDTPQRAELIRFITHIAIGPPAYHHMRNIDVKEWRERVATMQQPGYADQIRETRRQELASITDDKERELAEMRMFLSPEKIIERQVDALAAYDAVKARLDTIRGLLRDQSEDVKMEAAFALAWFPEEVNRNNLALTELMPGEKVDRVNSTLLIALGLLGSSRQNISDAAALVTLLRTKISPSANSTPLVRWASAIALILLHVTDTNVIDEALRIPEELQRLDGDEVVGDLKGIPFTEPSATTLVGEVLQRIDNTEAKDKLIAALTTAIPKSKPLTAIALTDISLQVAFERTDRPLASANLTEAQRQLVQALVEVDEMVWSIANFLWLLKGRGLPVTLTEMQHFAHAT